MDKFLGCLWSFILSPSWWRTHCSDKMDASEKYSGRWMDTWCHLLTFPNSSSWWWLISSVFFTRTSCCKTAHANGYYVVWPRWAVSVHMLPLTVHGVTKSQTRLRLSTGTLNEIYWIRNRLLQLKWKYLLTYQWTINGTDISNFWPPNVDEGSPNCSTPPTTHHSDCWRAGRGSVLCLVAQSCPTLQPHGW